MANLAALRLVGVAVIVGAIVRMRPAPVMLRGERYCFRSCQRR